MPEQMSSLEYGTLWRRYCAFAIDCAICAVLSAVYALALYSFTGVFFEVIHSAVLFYLGLYVIGFCYFVFLESSSLQGTFGKLFMGLKVTGRDGNGIGLKCAFVRCFAKLILPISICIGLFLLISPFFALGFSFPEYSVIFPFTLAFLYVGFAGLFMMVWTSEKQGLHDFISGTLVVKLEDSPQS